MYMHSLESDCSRTKIPKLFTICTETVDQIDLLTLFIVRSDLSMSSAIGHAMHNLSKL